VGKIAEKAAMQQGSPLLIWARPGRLIAQVDRDVIYRTDWITQAILVRGGSW